MRLSALFGAVLLGVLGYRHYLAGTFPWWHWAAELVAGCGLLTLAFPGASVAEDWPRRAARWACGALAAVSTVLAIRLVPRAGAELGAAAAALVALGSLALLRWRPFAATDIACVTEGSPSAGGHELRFLPLRVTLAVAAVAMNLLAIYWNGRSHLAGFLLWLASLCLLPLAVWRKDPGGDSDRCPWRGEGGAEPSARGTVLALVLILLLATALRVLLLTETPPWINPDEGRLGRWGERMWSGGFPDAFGLGWNAFPQLAYLVGGFWVQILGVSNAHLRLASASVGALTIVPLFFWARRWWGEFVALLAAFLLAINREHILWSRIGLNNIQQVLVAALMLAAFARVLARRRAIDWVWLGYATGLAFHTYHAAKLFPALLALVGLVLAIGIPGFLRSHVRGSMVGTLGFLLCVGPLLVSTYERWSFFWAGTANRMDLFRLAAAFQAGDVHGVRSYLDSHVVGCLSAFFDFPSVREAILDPFVAVPFLLGLGWMLWRWRDPRHLTVLAWLLGILVVAGMMTDYPPSKARMIGFLPAVVVIPAIVAARARGLVLRCLGSRGELLAAPLLALWAGAALHYNWYSEFIFRPTVQRGDVLSEMCRVIERTPLPATLYLAGGGVMSELRVAANDCMIAPRPDRVLVNLPDDPSIVPVPPTNRGDAILLLTARQRELVPLVRHYYPDAREDIVHDPGGHAVLHVFTLPQRLIDSHRGLRETLSSGGRTWTRPEATAAFGPPQDVVLPLDAEWVGQIRIDTPGPYAFRTTVGSPEILGRPFVPGEAKKLPAGWLPIRLGAHFITAGESVSLEWLRPGGLGWETVPRAWLVDHADSHGLLGRYYAGVLPERGPVPATKLADYERVDTVLSFDWYSELDDRPPQPFAARPSTMEWVGAVDLPDVGAPGLRLVSTTPAQVFLDGTLVASTQGTLEGETFEAELSERGRRVPILVRSVRPGDGDDWRFWQLRLLWRGAAGEWTAFAHYHPPAMEIESVQ